MGNDPMQVLPGISQNPVYQRATAICQKWEDENLLRKGWDYALFEMEDSVFGERTSVQDRKRNLR